ncbi:hypothetical protein GCM10023349_33480 [Nocardioides conyzicola]|uniref:Uncharacterized protein n=1 Tax=Nocardioides conyzicola TaxID=1651781 RepID=A0ABP8XNF5_9ACTN
MAGASAPPAISAGPAAVTVVLPRTAVSSPVVGPEPGPAVEPAVAPTGRARSGVASRLTMLASPTMGAEGGAVAADGTEAGWPLWPIGVRRTRPANRDCCERSCHDGRATRRTGAPTAAAVSPAAGATDPLPATVAGAPLPGLVACPALVGGAGSTDVERETVEGAPPVGAGGAGGVGSTDVER